jgi:imidazoleglycerol-phosphate dehydratase
MIRLERTTRETQVVVTLDTAAGAAPPVLATGEPFLDHMLATLGRYAGLALSVEARGDLRHHLVEDVAITVGEAVRRALPDACARYGHRVIPMDDALVAATLDAGGRAYWEGPLPSALYDHWFRSFADAARFTLHVQVIRGRDRHHVIESAFKAVGLALRDARVETDAVFSMKGRVSLKEVPCSPEG